jgi:hypothetical protein
MARYDIPVCRNCISISNDLNSSVLSESFSPPILSFPHCFMRSNFLLIFILPDLSEGHVGLRGGRGEGILVKWGKGGSSEETMGEGKSV